jgi:hypothetical protein
VIGRAIMAVLLDPRVGGLDTLAGLFGRPAPRPAGYQAAWSNSNFGVSVNR